MPSEVSSIRRKLPAAERQRQILDAAAVVFARDGYHAAKTKDIAQEAGVSEGTLYNYFNSKRDILVSLTTLLASDPVEDTLQLNTVLDEEFIKGILRERFALIEQNQALIQTLVQEALRDRNLQKELLERIVQSAGASLLDWLQERIQSGTFRPVNPAVALAMIMAPLFLTTVMGVEQMPHIAAMPREEVIAQLADLCLNGLRGEHTQDLPNGP